MEAARGCSQPLREQKVWRGRINTNFGALYSQLPLATVAPAETPLLLLLKSTVGHFEDFSWMTWVWIFKDFEYDFLVLRDYFELFFVILSKLDDFRLEFTNKCLFIFRSNSFTFFIFGWIWNCLTTPESDFISDLLWTNIIQILPISLNQVQIHFLSLPKPIKIS